MKQIDKERFKKALKKAFCIEEYIYTHTQRYDGERNFCKDDEGYHLVCLHNPISITQYYYDEEVFVVFGGSVLYVYRFKEATQEYITVLTYFWDEYHDAYEFLVDFTADVVRYFEGLKN